MTKPPALARSKLDVCLEVPLQACSSYKPRTCVLKVERQHLLVKPNEGIKKMNWAIYFLLFSHS